MDIEDEGRHVRLLIRDRDGKFPSLFDTVLADAGIQVVLSGVRIPRMNAIMERWIRSCRHELLDRTLIWNQQHLLHALREYEKYYNTHRPRQGIANTRPCASRHQPSPTKLPSPDSTSANGDDWAAFSTSTTTRPAQAWIPGTPRLFGRLAIPRRTGLPHRAACPQFCGVFEGRPPESGCCCVVTASVW
ncbi:integrase core domain-containing protein [Actinosynnema sp. NPDC051121]